MSLGNWGKCKNHDCTLPINLLINKWTSVHKTFIKIVGTGETFVMNTNNL